MTVRRHRMPFGAEVRPEGAVDFRLWAPAARQVEVVLEGPGARRVLPLEARGDGWHALEAAEAGGGTRYRYRIDGGLEVPDPASRFQPGGVHEASEVVDPQAFPWSDGAWNGRPWREAVFYELHVGAFTPGGTFAAVAERLDHLVDLGVTAVELMPVAAAPGARNWGYDGVGLFAPNRCYGRPEDLKALVQVAHGRGLMVFLDVVYNHFGPEGNYLGAYAPAFFTDRHHTPWGKAINFDGADSRTVRDFFIHNALYWLEEYHFDGLRLDAVHAIIDDSEPDILTELAATVHARIGGARHVHLVLENDDNAARYLARAEDGRPRLYAAEWDDDIHHALHAAATGEDAGYYADYADAPVRRLGRCLAEGFAYQGDASAFRDGARRGEPSAHLPPTAFVSFLQNHDQVGNRAFGERITELAAPEAVRAMVAVMLLAPLPPLLFMGQEWAAPQPFLFFCDFGSDLADAVREGRRREFARFPQFADEAARKRIPDPNAPETFARSVLNWADARVAPHREWLALHRELLRLRHAEVVPRLEGMAGHAGAYFLLGERTLTARWRMGDGSDLHLLANLGPAPAAAPDGPARGRLLYATHDGLGRPGAELLPWSVAWLLDEGAGASKRG